MAPSCWQRRPARRHWQEVQGWRSSRTWRWSNTEPGVGFWCKEVLLVEESYFSIKLEIVVPLPHFFALFVIKICKTPWFLSRLEKEKHLYFGHFQQKVNLPFIQPARWHDSARAVTGKRCPHSGVGGDFLARRPAKMEFGPKSEFLGPKNIHFLVQTMF